MTIYCAPYAPIPNRAALLALMPPARRVRFEAGFANDGPLFAYALLTFALERALSLDAGALRFTDGGKPYLPGRPVHLSLSHSRTHALCALASFPLGCDIETHRPVSERTRRYVLGAGESADDFFAHWTLKESWFKLTGDRTQSFSDVRFTLTGDSARGQGVYGWLYRDIPGCTAAVVAARQLPRPALMCLPPETLFSYAAEK